MSSHLALARKTRCAIYTRKSVTEGLGRDYNTLESQRDVCSAYVRTRRHQGWMEIAERYDDGGFSGSSLVRPALQRLIADVERGMIDVVVIYKLDRLTRSLADFIRLIDLLERYDVTFVSVTQSFDTQDSMGRLVLNILLTFAQFEREMLIDRIRDKIAAMKRAGRWTGGPPPLGYDVVEGKLVVNESEAMVVRDIFSRYLEIGSYKALADLLQAEGLRSKAWINRNGASVGGGLASRGMVWSILGNPLYVGEIRHEHETYQGIHEPIVDRQIWTLVQSLRAKRKTVQPPARTGENPLVGLLFDGWGRKMVCQSGRNAGGFYRYYVSDQNRALVRQGQKRLRARADDLEDLVKVGLCSLLRNRPQLSPLIASLGIYDNATEKLIGNGPVAARRIETLNRPRTRLVYEALIFRIECDRAQVTIMVRLTELLRFLQWDGVGLFRPQTKPDRSREARIHCIQVPATAVRSERTLTLPIAARTPGPLARPNRGLVDLLTMARLASATVYRERERSIADIASDFGRTPAFLNRVIRLNYLAPDIITAILDGRQPANLTRKRLLYASLPMDWGQQRALLGFPAFVDGSA